MTNPFATPFPLARRTQVKTLDDNTRFVLLAVLVGGLFFAINHNLSYTQTVAYDFAPSSADSANAVAEGSSLRKVCFLLLGGIGALLLVARRGLEINLRDPLALAMLGYWAYCVASVLWSVEPSLTLRRVIVLSCCMLAVFGFVRQLRKEQLLALAFYCSLAFVLAGVAGEMMHGVFRPWESGYRFSGTVHPNSQGQLCSLLCLAAYARLRHLGRFHLGTFAVLALGAGLLILTKSRTSCLALAIGILLMWLPFARPQRLALASFGLPFLVCAFVLVAMLFGADVEAGTTSTLTMGRGGSIGSFTGRIPLWTEVAPHALERPLLGHGYLSFWTPWRIQELSERLSWTIPDAHNEYLETLLNLGIVGALLLTITLVGSLLRSIRAYLGSGDPCLGFFAAMLTISMVCGVFESGFAQPLGLVPFITTAGAAFCVCRLASVRMPRREAMSTAPRGRAAQ